MSSTDLGRSLEDMKPESPGYLIAVAFNQAIQLDPKSGRIYGDRGIIKFYKGDFAGSADDLVRAKFANDAYRMLWLYLARGKTGQDGAAELAANAASLTTRDWPFPVIDFYRGQRSQEAMQKSAVNPDQSCEANFYAGEWQVLNGNRDAAINLLKSAADACPKTFLEFKGALAELKRLER